MMMSTAITTISENKKERSLADGSRFAVMFGALLTDSLELDDSSVVASNIPTKKEWKCVLFTSCFDYIHYVL